VPRVVRCSTIRGNHEIITGTYAKYLKETNIHRSEVVAAALKIIVHVIICRRITVSLSQSEIMLPFSSFYGMILK